jgi:hypothetical protein
MRAMSDREPDQNVSPAAGAPRPRVDPAAIVLPETSLAPNALPSAMARGLAFAAVIIAGICGGLVGWAVTDLQCTGECGTPSTVGSVVGALLAAGGVAVISVLTLRAMAEWNQQTSIRNRR